MRERFPESDSESVLKWNRASLREEEPAFTERMRSFFINNYLVQVVYLSDDKEIYNFVFGDDWWVKENRTGDKSCLLLNN